MMKTSGNGAKMLLAVAIGLIMAGGFCRPATGMLYKPEQCRILWDVWVVYEEGVYYLYYVSNRQGYWDGISMATSKDGLHWDEIGEVISMPDDVVWLGGCSSFWKIETIGPDGLPNTKHITSFSEWRGPERTIGQQSIFFATSKDLLKWERLGKEYELKADPRWYKVNDGVKSRWDGMAITPKSGGGYYGYLTASPDQPGLPLAEDGSALAFGMAESSDGLYWKAIAPPVIEWGDMLEVQTTTEAPALVFRAISVGDIEKIQGRYYLLNTSSGVLVADQATGPFRPQSKNVALIPERYHEGNRYPRFFRSPHGLLYIHHSAVVGGVYLAPMKRALVDDEGILRLAYWEGNDGLKADSIAVNVPQVETKNSLEPLMFANQFDTTTGIIMEGTIKVPSSPDLQPAGIAIKCENGEVIAMLVGVGGVTQMGALKEDFSGFARKGSFDRETEFGESSTFKLLLRGGLAEFYLDNILMQSYHLPALAGAELGTIQGANRKAITELKAWQMDL